MKRLRSLSISILVLLVVTLACGSGGSPIVPAASTVPQGVAAATLTFTPTITPTVKPSGPCYNILYPFVPGYQWIYQIDNEDGSQPSKLGLTVDKVENSQATINALDMSTGVITQTIAECDNGAIKNYPTLTQKMLIGNTATSDFNLEYVAGVIAPAEATFTENNWLYQWTTDFIANGTIHLQDEGEQSEIILQDSPVHLDWKTIGAGDATFESVTVPAGTFEHALKIQREAKADATVVAEGMTVNVTLTLNTTQWYEPFTGLIKSQIDSADLTSMNMTFPLPLKNKVELVEFRSGQ
jgi:hypothetical protein